jgi:hypothetical protein
LFLLRKLYSLVCIDVFAASGKLLFRSFFYEKSFLSKAICAS